MILFEGILFIISVAIAALIIMYLIDRMDK